MPGKRAAERGAWDAIPTDLLAEVLEKLPYGDAQSISSVYQTCRHWRDNIRLRQQTLKPKVLHHKLATIFPNLQSLNLRACSYHPDQLAVLSQLRGLKSLALQLSKSRDAVCQLAKLQSLPLTSLELNGSTSELHQALMQVSKCTSLRTLDLSKCDLNISVGSMLDVLWNLTQLENLAISKMQQPFFGKLCQVDNGVFDALARMPNLAQLDLQHHMGVTERCLRELTSLKRLLSLRLGHCADLPDAAFELIACHTQLTELQLSFQGNHHLKAISPEVLQCAASLPRLASLELTDFDTSRLEEVDPVSGFRSLTRLSISHAKCPKPDGGMQSLLSSIFLGHLSSLRLNKCALTSKDMQLISNATGLTALDISKCPNQRGKDLLHLSGLTNLESLNLDKSDICEGSAWNFLQRVTGLTELSWAAPTLSLQDPEMAQRALQSLLDYAPSLTRLQRLNMHGHALNGAQLQSIAALTALTQLDMSGPSWDCSAVICACEFNLGLSHLAFLHKLRHLSLAHTTVDERGLCAMSHGLKALEHLDLSGTALEGEGLAQLAALPRLHTLLLNKQPLLEEVSDSGLADVSRLRALRHLEVRDNHCITAAGLKNLTALTGLSHLDVCDSSFINPKKALKSLQGCTALRVLRLGRAGSVCHAATCTEPPAVSAAAVAAFHARLPFLHTLDLAPHHITQDCPAKASVANAIGKVEDCVVWLILRWLALKGIAMYFIGVLGNVIQ